MAKFVTCVDIYGKKYKVSTDKLSWRPAAYGIVVKNNSVLLSKQFDGYDLPGGGVDLGESLEDAVIREIKEETGITAKNPKALGAWSSYFKMPRDYIQFVQSIMLYYECDFVSGQLSTAGFDEHEKQYADMPEWYDISKLDDIKVASSVDWRPLVRQVAKTK